jgi:hypothetical protein
MTKDSHTTASQPRSSSGDTRRRSAPGRANRTTCRYPRRSSARRWHTTRPGYGGRQRQRCARRWPRGTGPATRPTFWSQASERSRFPRRQIGGREPPMDPAGSRSTRSPHILLRSLRWNAFSGRSRAIGLGSGRQRPCRGWISPCLFS